jgi:hypothetical protein
MRPVAAIACEAIGGNENKIRKFWYCRKGRQNLAQRADSLYAECNRPKHAKQLFRCHIQMARHIKSKTIFFEE